MSEITSITVVVPVTNLTDEIATLRAQLAAAESRAERLAGLLRECEATLTMWADVAPAVTLRADIRAALAEGEAP